MEAEESWNHTKFAQKLNELLTGLRPKYVCQYFKEDSTQILRKIIPRVNSIAFRNKALAETFTNIMERTRRNKDNSRPKR